MAIHIFCGWSFQCVNKGSTFCGNDEVPKSLLHFFKISGLYDAFGVMRAKALRRFSQKTKYLCLRRVFSKAFTIKKRLAPCTILPRSILPLQPKMTIHIFCGWPFFIIYISSFSIISTSTCGTSSSTITSLLTT